MWKVAALYKFMPLEDLPKLQQDIKSACLDNDICGTLLLAPEGINGTIAGPEAGLDAITDYLDHKLEIRKGELKYSHAEEKPFRRMKVRLKREIITMKQPEANPAKKVGTYVDPENWNNLLNDPDVVVLDTRNKYETAVGTFKNAIDPETDCFTELPDFIEKHLDPEKHKKIAMYCTGGIRCEKASSYMLSKGFEEVYHLKGGILKYLEDMPLDQSLWNGDCFVFDRRVAVTHGLEESAYTICYGCRYPLSEDDLHHASYEEGVSCPHCVDTLTPEKAHAFRERHRQMLGLKKKEA